ncbi:hypothetical protein HDU96_004028 [Phlyctochytrium bullatum]|nr:hypothetical protein HDU96_004028 [Phlyctochytrium bullatum]
MIEWITRREISCTGEERVAQAKESRRIWIERLFSAARRMSWEVKDDNVALGGRSTDKNFFLEGLSAVVIMMESPTALRLLLELEKTIVPYEFLRYDERFQRFASRDANVTCARDQTGQKPRPGLLHTLLYAACNYKSAAMAHFRLDQFPEKFQQLMCI